MVNQKEVGDGYKKKFNSTHPQYEFYYDSVPVEKSEQILAEVIDSIYLEIKEDFVDENGTHRLGEFKERVKQEYHNKLWKYVRRT